MLSGKHIVVGITGGIAAYKAAIVVRGLVKAGAEVKVIMTPLAKEFITPLTLATLSKNPILVDFFNPENGNWNSHVDLGIWADAFLIAPATANTMAKMAHGVADNLLLTTYLSSRCPVVIAPAMDLDMFQHRATLRNLETLQKDGVHIIEPASGELASGLEGKGRMAEPEIIVDELVKLLSSQQELPLKNKNILISAGPTIEPIDPVRYISNHSSGKMGFALANKALSLGANVTLVSGPTSQIASAGVNRINVQTAHEMHQAMLAEVKKADMVIFSAAVADFRPKIVHAQKMKGQTKNSHIELEPTVDIAAELGRQKTPGQLFIGFALETENELANAQEKLAKKNLDAIVLNSLNDSQAGFGVDTNKITIIDNKQARIEFPVKNKNAVALDILQYAINRLQ